MIRTGIIAGTLLVGLLLVVAAPVSAQNAATRFEFTADGPAGAWEVEGTGATTQANVQVNLCWDEGGLNPQEGTVEATIQIPPSDDMVDVAISSGEENVFTFRPSQFALEPECGDPQTMNVDIVITGEVPEGTHTHRIVFSVTGEAGNIGTYTAPDDASADMDIEIELLEDPFATPTETETGGNGDNGGNDETEEGPAPGIVFVLVFSAIVAALRRRRN